MAQSGWQGRFDDPIVTPEGKRLATLRDAADHIIDLPAREAKQEHWQIAMELLISAADHGGIVMLARIAVLRALNHGMPAPQTLARPKRTKSYRLITIKRV